jgi:hypothetical protein
VQPSTAKSCPTQDSNISLLVFIEVYSNRFLESIFSSHILPLDPYLSLDQNSSRASHEALTELSIYSGERSEELCRSSVEVNLNEPQFRKETWYPTRQQNGCLGGVQYLVPSLDFRIPRPRTLGANCTTVTKRYCLS